MTLNSFRQLCTQRGIYIIGYYRNYVFDSDILRHWIKFASKCSNLDGINASLCQKVLGLKPKLGSLYEQTVHVSLLGQHFCLLSLYIITIILLPFKINQIKT